MQKIMMIALGVVALTGLGSCGSAAPDKKEPFDMVDVPSRSVLTGNPVAGELGLETGATYVADPPFANPVDPQNNRLIDGDKVLDWTTTTGINYTDQTVTFDLKQSFDLNEVALNFDSEAKPAQVAVSYADDAEGPWKDGSTLALDDALAKNAETKDTWWRLPLAKAKGRFVKIDFKLKEWGWYLREVRIYGTIPVKVKAAARRGNNLVLADESGARAAIVLSDRTHSNALQAAQTFQNLAAKMTGVLLPIVPASKLDAKTTAIFIGDSAPARKNGVKVEQNPFGDDRYVMQTGKNWLALVGNDARPSKDGPYVNPFCGSTYAVYDFFERQGFGWFGPDELWQVAPKKKVLMTPPLKVAEAPVFLMRDLWLGGLNNPGFRQSWRLGGFYIRSNHNYDNLVPPAKYKADHPEWFGEGQPDLTHPEVIKVAVETLGAELDARPDEPYISFPVSANDTGGFKDPPFKPEVGNIAAQQLYFANEIAKGLRVSHPGRRFVLGILGYWYSHDGPDPMLKGEPEVLVSVVSEGNHAKPLDLPEPPEVARNTGRNNTREINALNRWKQTGRMEGIYEWWIPVLANPIWKDSPWYDGSTTVRNLRLWREHGIRNLTYEIQAEKEYGFPLRWAQYYIAARAMWNPDINPHQVLFAANQKLFGKAAKTMTDFYEIQQTAMRDTKEMGGNWALPAPHLIYTPEVEAQGDVLLAQAQKELNALPESDAMRMRLAVEVAQWKLLESNNAAARAKLAEKKFKVSFDDKLMDFGQSKIKGVDVRELFGIPADVMVEAREADGQNRALLAEEEYDLGSGITFHTAPQP